MCYLNGHLDKAVEFLEGGRAVFWSQALHLRSPFDKLLDISPELGERLHATAMELERGSHRKAFDGILDNRAILKLEQEASHFEKLNNAWLDGPQKSPKIWKDSTTFCCPVGHLNCELLHPTSL